MAQSFATCYMDLCKQQRLRPLPVICVTLPHHLDFTTDRVKMDDWGPILNSLSLDRTLKSISVRSRYQCRKPLEEVNSEDKARAIGKAPVVLTRFLLEWLSHSVAQCVRNSVALTSLELEGIPFPADCLAVLSVGLASSQSLEHLSLQRCYIGDGSCQLICRTIADVRSIRSLNLAQCDLSCQSGAAVAAALSRQKLSLYHDTWKQSLRYREPNLEAMPGLRRLTLNGNPKLGDVAVKEVLEVVRDSLWLKALDLQSCGLTDSTGYDVLSILGSNTTLTVVDVRLNGMSEELIKEIAAKLESNNASGRSEYRWLVLPQKDKRTASAGAKRNAWEKNKKIEGTRPKTANGPTKRTCQAILPRRIITLPNLPRKPRTVPAPPSTPSQESELESATKSQENQAKPTLHLDLQSQICPATSMEVQDEPENKVTEREKDTNKIEEILRQLSEARSEHERLLEDIKRNDLLLEEERMRRELAEAKLQSTKNDLLDLENALKEKEMETRGCLLVSQESLNEICSSFDQLLEMLDAVTRHPNTSRTVLEEDVVRMDIKRQVARLIRKTKSENLERGYSYDRQPESSARIVETSRKFVRSEHDVRSSLPPIAPIHIERKIGDSPDVETPTQESRRRRGKVSDIPSPRERARAIFAQIINGDSVLNLGSYVS
ncbi:centrosomal protein of 78 kDa [Cephus cinctus]|uniref:Centrosomal protein of 78 kDa n=1 Tax=Cephus cinctus TaxID=211228 RepID=A0AAJ7R8Q2_CEPCN|nr:centrosomal protein of 78 kDa [Cephus cinctus]